MAEENKTAPAAVNPDAFSLRLYDHENSQWINTTPQDAYQKVLTGKYTFESGIRIPAISMDGKVGSILSDNAYDEFASNGVKPLTSETRKLSEDVANDKILQKVYGDHPVDAFIQGALRPMTLGVSDVVNNLAGVAEGAKQTKERNPVASTAGEIAGTAASIVEGGPLAEIGGETVYGAGKLASTGAAAARSLGAKAGEGLLGQVASTAAEGAYFGLGHGVSEAALGKPEDTIQHLASGVGMGALVGGAFGAAFGVAERAKPYLDSLVSKSLDKGADVVNKIGSKVAASGMKAALTSKGESELGQNVADFITSQAEGAPEARAAIARGLGDAVKTHEQELTDMVRAGDAARKDLGNEVLNSLKSAADQSKVIMSDAVEQAGMDVHAATAAVYDHTAMAEDTLMEHIATGANHVPVYDSELTHDVIKDSVEQLRALKNGKARSLANQLEAVANTAGGVQNAADEANSLFRLYKLTDGIKGAENYTALTDLKQLAEKALSEHPNPAISQAFNQWKAYNDATGALRNISDEFVNKLTKRSVLGDQIDYKTADGVKSVFDAKKAVRTLSDPINQGRLTAALDNLDQLAPEIKAFNDTFAIKDTVAQADAQGQILNALKDKIKSFNPKLDMSPEDSENLIALLKPFGDVSEKVTKYQELSQALGRASPTEKYLALTQALGKDASPIFKEVTKFQNQLAMMERLGQISAPGFNVVKAAIGGKMGGLLGIAFGAQKSNFANHVDTVLQVQQATKTGAALLAKATEVAGNALIGKTAQTAFKSVAFRNNPNVDLESQKAAYPKLQQALLDMQSPSPTEDPRLPNTYKALDAHKQAVAQFLLDKMPPDTQQHDIFNFNKDKAGASDYEMSQFFRYANTANNPLYALKNFSEGKVSPEEVETLKTLYPAVYQGLQNQVLSGIIKDNVSVSYGQKLQLSQLFDVSADYTMRPEFIGQMQNNINQPTGGRPNGASNRKITIDLHTHDNYMTEAQKITNK